eukprot:TRINITY_DN1190_c0_g1_i14.p1 TRINITY_DN1190_c0_g1~~TRINITY_DN1190_c0_g1_i14.p1  ORF type:complete len:106 (-),score=18.97 TRINITY_DN1190_c0_g1_i14:186-503(-)
MGKQQVEHHVIIVSVAEFEMTALLGSDVSGNSSLQMPRLSFWTGMNDLTEIVSDWPDEYVSEALEECKKKFNWRRYLAVLISKGKERHPLMDHYAFLSTTIPFLA